jgi:hypothetical protein
VEIPAVPDPLDLADLQPPPIGDGRPRSDALETVTSGPPPGSDPQFVSLPSSEPAASPSGPVTDGPMSLMPPPRPASSAADTSRSTATPVRSAHRADVPEVDATASVAESTFRPHQPKPSDPIILPDALRPVRP